MSNMFCFQCQQTAGNKACVNTGGCGKQPSTAGLQDELILELIRLAEAARSEGRHSRVTDRLLIDGLFTTNCLMPQRPSYQDRIYTTSVAGYEHDRSMSGINGGHILTTGFAHGSVLAHAEQIISSIKKGSIKHIFLVGGCDGAHPGCSGAGGCF